MSFGPVLFDSTALERHPIRGLVLTLGMEDRGLFDVRWTERILFRVEQQVQRFHFRGRMSSTQAAGLVEGMRELFPGAMIPTKKIAQAETQWDQLLPQDPMLRHIYAAAIAGDVGDVVSYDAGDYASCNSNGEPGQRLPEVFSPDDFFMALYAPYFDAAGGRPLPANPVEAAIRDLAAATPCSVSQLLERYSVNGLPQFRQQLRHMDDQVRR